MSAVLDGVEFNRRLFYPRRDTSPPPLGASDLFVAVPNGRLHVRKHGVIGARVTVMMFHGNGEVVADYDATARPFAEAGAALAVVDYRGYGKSQGEPTLRNLVQDSHAVITALAERTVIVMGRSLGSVAAAELYQDPPPSVIGFIWESGIADVDALVNRRDVGNRPPLSQEERLVLDPIPKLRSGRSPLLVIHGAEDELVPPLEAQVAFGAAGTGVKELVLVPEMGHNDLSSAPIYWQAIAAFIRNRIADSPGTP